MSCRELQHRGNKVQILIEVFMFFARIQCFLQSMSCLTISPDILIVVLARVSVHWTGKPWHLCRTPPSSSLSSSTFFSFPPADCTTLFCSIQRMKQQHFLTPSLFPYFKKVDKIGKKNTFETSIYGRKISQRRLLQVFTFAVHVVGPSKGAQT